MLEFRSANQITPHIRARVAYKSSSEALLSSQCMRRLLLSRKMKTAVCASVLIACIFLVFKYADATAKTAKGPKVTDKVSATILWIYRQSSPSAVTGDRGTGPGVVAALKPDKVRGGVGLTGLNFPQSSCHLWYTDTVENELVFDERYITQIKSLYGKFIWPFRVAWSHPLKKAFKGPFKCLLTIIIMPKSKRCVFNYWCHKQAAILALHSLQRGIIFIHYFLVNYTDSLTTSLVGWGRQSVLPHSIMLFPFCPTLPYRYATPKFPMTLSCKSFHTYIRYFKQYKYLAANWWSIRKILQFW